MSSTSALQRRRARSDRTRHHGRRWFSGPAGAARLVGSLVLLSSILSCPDDDRSDPIVIRIDDDVLRVSEIVTRYELQHGQGTFAGTTRTDRLELVETMADEEVLVREAARRVPSSSRRTEIQLVRYLERELVDAYLRGPGAGRSTASIVDSLFHQERLALVPESYGALRRVFNAYWDSLNVLQRSTGGVDYLTLEPPRLDRISAAERARPVADLRIGALTVAEFVSSHRECDLEFWLTISRDDSQTESQVRRRLARWVLERAARRERLTEDPTLVARMDAHRRRLRVEDLREHLWRTGSIPPEEELRTFYETRIGEFQDPGGETMPFERARGVILASLRKQRVDNLLESVLPEWRRDHRLVTVSDAVR